MPKCFLLSREFGSLTYVKGCIAVPLLSVATIHNKIFAGSELDSSHCTDQGWSRATIVSALGKVNLRHDAALMEKIRPATRMERFSRLRRALTLYIKDVLSPSLSGACVTMIDLCNMSMSTALISNKTAV